MRMQAVVKSLISGLCCGFHTPRSEVCLQTACALLRLPERCGFAPAPDVTIVAHLQTDKRKPPVFSEETLEALEMA